MRKIEWTDIGREYAKRCQVERTEADRLGTHLKTIRHSLGFPFWEVKKALYNAQGDAFVAIKQLKEHASAL